jgi:ECF sigma factor
LSSVARFVLERRRSLVAAGWVGGYNPANPTFFSADLAPMTEITGILSAIKQGDPHAAAQLLPLVYEELRKLAAPKLAQEKPGR